VEGLRKLRKSLNPQSRPIQDMLKQWAARYRSFAQKRFLTFSRGGSDETGTPWPPLKPATIAGRARQSVRKRRKVLRRQIRQAQQRLRSINEKTGE
jgi:hypothetical protein